MERIKERAQYVLESSEQCPRELLKSDSAVSSGKGKSLNQKLLELYLEETEKQEEDSSVCNASHLLGKLVKRDGLKCLVLSLYPGNEGYTLMLRSRSGVDAETMKLPYEEADILEYIDAGELPPFLLDLLEKAQVSVFYSGCVIVEVRDYRRSAPGSYDTHYVLLRPSAQSVMADIAALAHEFGGGAWTPDDLHQLEAEILLRISEPLCLDPSPAVAMVNTLLNHQQKRFNDPSLKRAVKEHTQVAANRKRKLEMGPAPKELQLLDFIQKKRDKSKTPTRPIKSVDTWRQRSLNLAVPQNLEVPDSIFKVVDQPISPHDNLSMVEEHRLERDPNQEQRMLAVITVYHQHLADGYVGRLYLDHDYSGDDSSMQGCACFFPLGVRQNVDRYLGQFRELFTEEGRRLVKMSTKRPGQPEQVTYTAIQQTPTPTPTPPSTPTTPAVALPPPPPPPQAPPTTPAAALAAVVAATTGGMTMSNAQALLKQATSMAAAIVSQGEGGRMSLAAKRNIPIQLSLSITPISSTGILTAQGKGNQQGGITVAGQGNQSQVSAQRLKQLGLQHKATPSPLTSPTSTPTSTPQQIAAAILGQQTGGMVQKVPTPTPTPPPNSRTPTPTQPMVSSLPPSALTSRRPSTTTTPLEALSVPSSQPALPQAHNISFVTQEAVGGSGTSGGGGQGTTLSNINIASLSSLPPNINLHSLGLSSVNLSNLGLQHMQVSMPSIAVPVPITMINNTNPSLLHTHPAILTTTSSGPGSSQAALVTMVTALPASTGSSSSATSTTVTMSSQHLLMSTGSSQATVLPSNSGMLSLPVGLTQLMPVTTKTQGSMGLRAPASLPMLQLPGGQQSIQLLSLQQQQRGGGLKTGTITAAITSSHQQGQISRAGAGNSNTVPLSTVLTSQQMSALTSLTMGKAGGSTTIPAGQFIQLTAGGAAGAGMAPQGTSQTLHTQLAAFQKAGAGGAGGGTLQFHQLQLKQASAPTLTPVTAVAMATPAATSSSSSKAKGKKRGGATPPKSL